MAVTTPLDNLPAPAGAGEGALVLDALVRFVRRYVVLSEHQAFAIALWIMHTHAIEAADTTPYLWVTSPEKRSGKTRTLEVLDLVVPRSWFTSRASIPVIYRKIDGRGKSTDPLPPPPTLLFDESDAIFKGDKDFAQAYRSILDAGFRRGATVSVCEPPGWKPREFSAFAPKAIAGIGDVPETIADRAIRIQLERRRRDQPVERFRYREARAEGWQLQQAAAAWAKTHLYELRDARPDLPAELTDRSQDYWEPFIRNR